MLLLLITGIAFMANINYANRILNPTLERQMFFNRQNLSHDKLVVNPSSFIYSNGYRSGVSKGSLRIQPKYYLPNDTLFYLRLIDMMRQQIYATQERIKTAEQVVAKYKNDAAFRMAFIYNRLDQLIIDIRRIYTQAVRWRQAEDQRVEHHIVWYTHCFRKYIDILYIVEFVISEHTKFVKIILDG